MIYIHIYEQSLPPRSTVFEASPAPPPSIPLSAYQNSKSGGAMERKDGWLVGTCLRDRDRDRAHCPLPVCPQDAYRSKPKYSQYTIQYSTTLLAWLEMYASHTYMSPTLFPPPSSKPKPTQTLFWRQRTYCKALLNSQAQATTQGPQADW